MLEILVILGALILDRLGEPPNNLHPVKWFGNLIGKIDDLIPGLLGGLILTVVSVSIGYLISFIPFYLPFTTIFVVIFLKFSFSVRFLEKQVLSSLDSSLKEKRESTSLLVSRDTDNLNSGLLNSALIETLSENNTDSFFTPLFYFTIFGLPGALIYRCLDTLDSMVGYRERKLKGLIPSRTEDIATFIPSFLFLFPLSLAALSSKGVKGFKNGLKNSKKYRNKRKGFNGKIIAFYSGCIGVTLEKKGSYVIGSGKLPQKRHVLEGIKLFRHSIFFSLLTFILIIFLLNEVFKGSLFL